MSARSACFVAALVTASFLWTSQPAAQMTHRLKGSVRDTQGAAVRGAKVRADAILGFRGGQFVGQKEFEVAANDKGDWSILGLTAGVWLFCANAPGMAPQVIVLTINFSSRQPAVAGGGLLRWELPFTLPSVAGKTELAEAAEVTIAGKTGEATQLIGALSAGGDPDQLIVVGELALLARQQGLADAIFGKVLGTQPRHARALIGTASAALMNSDWDRASKQYWAARDVAPKELRQAIAGTIADLQQISVSGGR